MKNILTRGLALTVALLTVLAAFASCGKKEDPEAPGTSQTPPTQDTGDGFESKVPAGLDFGNETVTILVRAGDYWENEFDAENTGVLLDGLVFERNNRIEERLNVNIELRPSSLDPQSDYLQHIRTVASADSPGSPTYDILTVFGYYAAVLATEGLYYNVLTHDEANYISLDNAWFNQSFVEENTINDELSMLIGDANISATDYICLTYVNQNLLRDHTGIEVDTLFDVVEAGEWTLDYIYELASDIYTDLNYDGNRDSGDFYGIVYNKGSQCTDAMLYAMGITTIKRTEDGSFEWTISDPDNVNRFSKLYDFVYSNADGIKLNWNHNTQGYPYEMDGTLLRTMGDQMFYDEKCIFNFGELQSAQTFVTKSETFKYASLPMPKYDSDQEFYRTVSSDRFSMVAISSKVGDRIGMVSATIELLYEESYRTIRPEYYELAYQVRFATDANTAELFNMIVDGVYYGFDIIYSSSLENPTWKLRDGLNGVYAAPVGNLTGIWASNRSLLNSALNDLLETFGLS